MALTEKLKRTCYKARHCYSILLAIYDLSTVAARVFDSVTEARTSKATGAAGSSFDNQRHEQQSIASHVKRTLRNWSWAASFQARTRLISEIAACTAQLHIILKAGLRRKFKVCRRPQQTRKVNHNSINFQMRCSSWWDKASLDSTTPASSTMPCIISSPASFASSKPVLISNRMLEPPASMLLLSLQHLTLEVAN